MGLFVNLNHEPFPEIAVSSHSEDQEVFVNVNKSNKSRLDENTTILIEGETLEELENRLASEKKDLQKLENDIKDEISNPDQNNLN